MYGFFGTSKRIVESDSVVSFGGSAANDGATSPSNSDSEEQIVRVMEVCPRKKMGESLYGQHDHARVEILALVVQPGSWQQLMNLAVVQVDVALAFAGS